MHLLIANNILKGYGHSFLEANSSDISKTLSVPINFWPPGYSLLLIPFVLFGLKSWLTIALCDALAILLFYWIWYKILKTCLPNSFVLITCLAFAFFTFGYTPLGTYYAFGTNIWALVWFSLSLYYLLKVFQQEDKLSKADVALFFLFAFLCSFFRYSYYPVSFILIIGFLFFTYKKFGLKTATITAILPTVLFGLFFLYQFNYQPNVNYINSFHSGGSQGIYWSNLEHTAAIMSNSFTQPILYKSTNWFGSLSLFLSETGNFKWSQLLNGFIKYSFTLLFCIFFLPSSYHFYKKSNEQNKLYFKLGISLVILQVLFFVFLSLKYPPEIFKGIDIKQKTMPELNAIFGKNAWYFYNLVRGIDNRPVVSYRDPNQLVQKTLLQQIQ